MPSPQLVILTASTTIATWLSCGGLALADPPPPGSFLPGQAAASADVRANQQGTVGPAATDARTIRGRRPLEPQLGGPSSKEPVLFDRAVEQATFERGSSSAVDSSQQTSAGDRIASSKNGSNKGQPLALSPSGPKADSGAQATKNHRTSLTTVAASLALVLGLFFLVAWMLRRGLPKGGQLLPAEALEVLGRRPFAGKQQLQMLRFGNKVLLVSVAPGVAETLAEISDPTEVDRLVGLCQQNRPGSATTAFRNMLRQVSTNRTRSAPPTDPPADPPADTPPEETAGARTVRDMLEAHDV